MIFEMQVRMTNDAFTPDPDTELTRILAGMSRQCALTFNGEGVIHDVNGARVGEWSITDPVSDVADIEPFKPQFNPHGEKTSDGVVITLGMRVLDYNRRTGTVVRDRNATRYQCPAHPDYEFPENTVHGCYNGWDKPTHWFDVEGDEPGGGGMFDGSRMQSI
jgi:hypothetical protein